MHAWMQRLLQVVQWCQTLLSALGIVRTQTLLVRIDGNIASGKSTLIGILEEEIEGVKIVPEPLARWLSIQDDAGQNILGAFGRGGLC